MRSYVALCFKGYQVDERQGKIYVESVLSSPRRDRKPQISGDETA